MKTLTFGRRLNSALAALLLLFIAGVGFAVGMGYLSSHARKREGDLEVAKVRIVQNLLDMNAATAELLAAPDSDPEGDRFRAAKDQLAAIVDSIGNDWKNDEELHRTFEAASSFASEMMRPFRNQIAELVKTSRAADPAAAQTVYASQIRALRVEQAKIVGDLNTQVGNAIKQQEIWREAAGVITYAGLLVLVIAGIIIVRVPAAAAAASLTRLQDAVGQMQGGDFTRRLDSLSDQHFGGLGEGLNRVAEDVSALVVQVSRSGIQVNTTATEIAATAKEQQSTANEIAATTAEIGATSRQISATSRDLETTMNEVGRVAQDTAQLANNGQHAIAGMEATMRQIMDAAAAITAKLAILNDKTANVNSVVTTITKVADQTNLLSLNAAIEAEKAGEYGLGFAVVATEIRRLADQTAVATYDIEKMVKEMQSAVAAGVMGMDKFSEEVRRGVDEIRHVGAQLTQIIHQVQTLMPRFQAVNEGMHAQATGAQQISETLTQLSEAAHQTADSLLHSNIAIDQLNEAARGLQSSVAKFKARA